MTSGTYSIRLTSNLRAQIDSGDPGLSFYYRAVYIYIHDILMDLVYYPCLSYYAGLADAYYVALHEIIYNLVKR